MLPLLCSFALFAAAPPAVSLPAFATAHRFEQFPAPPEQLPRPASPRLTSPEARRYRTQLRRAAEAGPNFSGHVTVARWGCGACCTQFALIDRKSGEVWFPGFTVACSAPLTDPIGGSAAIYYRLDSSLFVVVGAPNEGPERGVYYYRWDGRGLALLGSEHVSRVE